MSKRAILHLSGDKVLSGVITRFGPIRMRARRHPLFPYLTRAIVYQQLSGKAAGTIFGRFSALFPNDVPLAERVAEMSVEQFRAVGVSRQKASYLLDLAKHSTAGLIPDLETCDTLTDLEIVERLTQVKGVGRWTVDMLLIFNLGRPDVLPTGDLGVRRGYQIAYGKRKLPEPSQLAEYGERWGPHRTMAARYLWRTADGE